jgi:hypothetical protein
MRYCLIGPPIISESYRFARVAHPWCNGVSPFAAVASGRRVAVALSRESISAQRTVTVCMVSIAAQGQECRSPAGGPTMGHIDDWIARNHVLCCAHRCARQIERLPPVPRWGIDEPDCAKECAQLIDPRAKERLGNKPSHRPFHTSARRACGRCKVIKPGAEFDVPITLNRPDLNKCRECENR